MDYLEKNLSVIKKGRQALYIKLEDILNSDKYSYNNIEEIETRDGNKALIIEKDNIKYRLNSIYRPLTEAEKWANQYEFQNLNILVIMFGMGNGLFVREMLKRLQSDATVYLYEPDITIFLYILNNVDISDILSDKRINLFINDINDSEFEELLQRNVDWRMLLSQIICYHPIYDKIYGDEYVKCLKIISKTNNLEKINMDTEKHLSVALAKNAVKNLYYVKESNYISEFIDKIPEELPAIIVAAGPSLDKNIDELKRAKGKAFIFATDTAVKHLIKHNINFDAMITIDSKKATGHLKDERCHNIPMFCVLEANTKFMEMHKGRKIWFRGSVYMYDLYNRFNREFPIYNNGGSVATAAFTACVSLGFKNIVLIGQDLAYSGNITHAGGNIKNIPGDKDGRELIESIDGGKIWTRYDWLIYLHWFEDAIKSIKDLNVIDATEGGALIHGTKVMKLSEVIDEYCNKDFSFKALLDGMPYTFTGDEYSRVRDDILDIKKEFIDMKQKANEGIKTTEQLIKIINSGKQNTKGEHNNLKKIDKINKFIGKQKAYSILDAYITSTVANDVQSINTLTKDENENMKKTLNISMSLYKALIQAIDALMPTLEETLEKI